MLSDEDTALSLTAALVAGSHDGGRFTDVLTILTGDGDTTVDGSTVTSARAILRITAGSGVDTLIGSAGNDLFKFAGGALTADDVVDGGAGGASILITSAGTVDTAHVTNVGSLQLSAAGNTVTLSDAFGASPTYVTGGTGNDVIDASAITRSGVWLIGGGGSNTLIGGAGADRLTGNGDDTYGFLTRGGPADTIEGFIGQSKLLFSAAQFDFNGAAFDTRVFANSAATDITGADLVIVSGSFASAADYLAHATGGSVDEGVFVLYGGALYHALDASFTHSTDIVQVTGFANNTGNSLALNDFLFI